MRRESIFNGAHARVHPAQQEGSIALHSLPAGAQATTLKQPTSVPGEGTSAHLARGRGEVGGGKCRSSRSDYMFHCLFRDPTVYLARRAVDSCVLILSSDLLSTYS